MPKIDAKCSAIFGLDLRLREYETALLFSLWDINLRSDWMNVEFGPNPTNKCFLFFIFLKECFLFSYNVLQNYTIYF